MPEVRWSTGALGDLDAIGSYFERTPRQYARSVVARLFMAVDALADPPHLGRVVPAVDVDPIREIVREG